MWHVYVGGQLLLGDILCALGHIDPAALKSVLIQRAKTHERLGEFMLARGLLTREALDEALALQQKLQQEKWNWERRAERLANAAERQRLVAREM